MDDSALGDMVKVSIESEGTPQEMLVIDNEEGELWGIPLAAIASWGQLLGLKDHAEIVDYIVHYRDNGQEWQALYDSLQENLDELSLAGVPAEYMADLVDPEMDSPIPGPAKQKKLKTCRNSARRRMKKDFREDAPELSAYRQSLDEVLVEKTQVIEASVVEFMDQNSPQYIIEMAEPVVTPPEPAVIPELPESVPSLQLHLTALDPDTI